MAPFYEKLNDDIRGFYAVDLNFPLHLHSQLEMVYVLENEMQMTINNRSWTFARGDFIIIFPNIIHSYESLAIKESKSKSLTIISDLALTGEYMNSLINYWPQEPFITKENLHENINFAIKELFKEIESSRNISACKAFIQLILARSFAKLKLVENESSEIHGITYKLVDFIAKNFKKDLSLDIIAKDLGISKYYLSRTFSNKLNTNFNDYINEIRLSHASMLIRTTNKLISQVSCEAGFTSQRTFNRVFKGKFDLTPSEYRYIYKERGKNGYY